QHAAMSIYQAYYDRTPVLLLAGRDEGFIAAHTAHDMAGMVRSFTKWDAQPKTLEESLTAIQRAYNEAITPPCAPTLVVLDIELQKGKTQNDEGAASPAAAYHRNRIRTSPRYREGTPGREESSYRRRPPANTGRSEECSRAGRACWRIH